MNASAERQGNDMPLLQKFSPMATLYSPSGILPRIMMESCLHMSCFPFRSSRLTGIILALKTPKSSELNSFGVGLQCSQLFY